MIYPTNDQMPEQLPEPPTTQPQDAREFSGLSSAYFDPTVATDIAILQVDEYKTSLRERLVSWLRVKLWIADDRTSALRMNAKVLGIFAAKDEVINEQARRIDSLERLVIENNRLIQFHHEVLKRWATGSATLRSLEDTHAKKLKRAQAEEERQRAIEAKVAEMKLDAVAKLEAAQAASVAAAGAAISQYAAHHAFEGEEGG